MLTPPLSDATTNGMTDGMTDGVTDNAQKRQQPPTLCPPRVLQPMGPMGGPMMGPMGPMGPMGHVGVGFPMRPMMGGPVGGPMGGGSPMAISGPMMGSMSPMGRIYPLGGYMACSCCWQQPSAQAWGSPCVLMQGLLLFAHTARSTCPCCWPMPRLLYAVLLVCGAFLSLRAEACGCAYYYIMLPHTAALCAKLAW